MDFHVSKKVVDVFLKIKTMEKQVSESSDSDNKGNFKAILDTIANHDRAVKKNEKEKH